MAILTELKVTEVADLRAEANNFENHATEVKNVTDRMLELIEQTNSVWRGDARTKYSSQFGSLRDDMQRIYDMCEEYHTDLIQIADNYERAESDNQATASSLKPDVQLR